MEKEEEYINPLMLEVFSLHYGEEINVSIVLYFTPVVFLLTIYVLNILFNFCLEWQPILQYIRYNAQSADHYRLSVLLQGLDDRTTKAIFSWHNGRL